MNDSTVSTADDEEQAVNSRLYILVYLAYTIYYLGLFYCIIHFVFQTAQKALLIF
jgi:hypothetical protein